MRLSRSRLVPFATARAFARSLKLATRSAWREWAKTHRAELQANGVPSRPDVAYGEERERRGRIKEWQGWTDWLRAGKRTITSRRYAPKEFMSFPAWSDWVVRQGFRRKEDYNDWCKGNRAERSALGVPSSPALIYAEFPGWNVALRKVAPRDKGRRAAVYVSFREARGFARSLKLRSAREWRDWACRETNRKLLDAYRIPSSPDRVAAYRNEFRGWRDFLGTDCRPTLNRKRR